MATTSGTVSFQTSYDIEADWDYIFVEAHEVGTDELDHAAGRQRPHHQETGESCPAGWDSICTRS